MCGLKGSSYFLLTMLSIFTPISYMLTSRWQRVIANELELASDRKEILALNDPAIYWLFMPIKEIKVGKKRHIRASNNARASRDIDRFLRELGFTVGGYSGEYFTYVLVADKVRYVVQVAYLEGESEEVITVYSKGRPKTYNPVVYRVFRYWVNGREAGREAFLRLVVRRRKLSLLG